MACFRADLNRKSGRKLVRPPRFERGTTCLEGRCSIQLSYGRGHEDISSSYAKVQAPADSYTGGHPEKELVRFVRVGR